MQLPLETFQLDNGLFVTLSEDHTAPIVAVNLGYHVGSANEREGARMKRFTTKGGRAPRRKMKKGQFKYRAMSSFGLSTLPPR